MKLIQFPATTIQPLTIQRAIELFKPKLLADGRSPRTIDSYLHDIRLLERFMAERNHCKETAIATITSELLNDFLVSEIVTTMADGTRKAESSVNKVKVSMKSFFNFLFASTHISSNPALGIRIRYIERPAPDILTDVEKKKLLKAISNTRGKKAFRDFTIFSLFLNTGIRISELVHLDFDDVNLAEKKITIFAKGGHNGIRFLNATVRRAIEPYLKQRKKMPLDTHALFVSNQGRRLSVRQVQRSFEEWLVAAGIEKHITVHGLRHSFASTLLERTGNLALVQQSLGHRHISTTTRYTHIASEELQQALETL